MDMCECKKIIRRNTFRFEAFGGAPVPHTEFNCKDCGAVFSVEDLIERLLPSLDVPEVTVESIIGKQRRRK